MKEYSYARDDGSAAANDAEKDLINDTDQDELLDDSDDIPMESLLSDMLNFNSEFPDINATLPDMDFSVDVPDTDYSDTDYSDTDYSDTDYSDTDCSDTDCSDTDCSDTDEIDDTDLYSGDYDENSLDDDVVKFFPDEDVSHECRAEKAGIVLTFDDLLVSSWYKMHQDLFIPEGIKATFFLSRVYFLEEGSTSVLKLLEMIEYGHEMGCHTMHHYKLSEYLEEKPVDQYIEEEIKPSIEKAASLGISFKSFAYPFGNGNNEVDGRLFEYFNIIRYTGGILDKDNPRPYFIDRCRNILMSGAIDDPYSVDKDDITAALERAKEYNSIVVILAHEPTEEGPGNQSYYVTYDLLQHLIDEGKRLNMPFYTISEAFGKSVE